jgi:hypothetical protein
MSAGAYPGPLDAIDPTDPQLAPEPGKHARQARLLLLHRPISPLEQLIV